MKNKILVIAAHPDDEILGCGGTIARLVHEGNVCHTAIFGEGITSRDAIRDRDIHLKELDELKNNVKHANKILGVSECYNFNFPDNRFDGVDLLDIVKEIESLKNQIQPDIIFTHFVNDLNIDHTILNRAVLTATRPMQEETVKEIYAFEVLSSTEWNYPLSFSPDVFFNITDYLEIKKKAMSCYRSEIREFPHPRSLEGIELASKFWGMRVGCPSAEAFKLLRMIRK